MGISCGQQQERSTPDPSGGFVIPTAGRNLLPPAWKNAARGRFYRLAKEAVVMRVDADVIALLTALD